MKFSSNPSRISFPPPLSLPEDWKHFFEEECSKSYMSSLYEVIQSERKQHSVFPTTQNVYRAFELCPLENTSVVILGQDPYASEGQAHGLSFSVLQGTPIPPSLRNIFQELKEDLNIPVSKHGQLDAWAQQGVLLLNSILTVRAHTPLSHQGIGWETFTDTVLKKISDLRPHVVFILWGQHAQRKLSLLAKRHTVIQSTHPSPLSAYRGFLGSKPFSATNRALLQHGQSPIHWKLPA